MGSAEGRGAEPTDEQLARLVLRSLAALIVLTMAGGIATAAIRLGEQDDGAGPATVAADAVTLSPRGGIGPLPGTSTGAYQRARALEVAELRQRRVAVVSFASYETPAAARQRLAAVEVVRLLVAVPGGRPAEVTTDADAAAVGKRQRQEATEERAALQELLPTVRDADFRRQYETDIERLTRLLEAPPVPEIVYAAVVAGTPDRLRALAGAPGIRLVDVGADDTVPGRGAVSGLRPEETSTAGDPPVRPAG